MKRFLFVIVSLFIVSFATSKQQLNQPSSEENAKQDAANPDIIIEGSGGLKLYVNGLKGSDTNDGSSGAPFKTINKAAQAAMPGDTVVVSAGVYREQVKPLRGGTGEEARITYTTAGDGDVVIKGSERMTGWIQQDCSNVWYLTLPNSFFGSYNPYTQPHWHGGNGGSFAGYNAGDVYLEEEAYCQKPSLTVVRDTTETWYSEVVGDNTTIYANFGGMNPNSSLVEINVRRQIFAPEVWGLQYITVDGFTFMHAANWYSDFPNAIERAQMGAISVYGGYRWIIQNNRVINARTIGIDIGLGCDAWAGNRPGAKTHYTQTDQYGEHIVRNNYIARCGQSGIAGVFSWKSQMLYNHIEDNNYRNEFSGSESAPIKVHYCNYGLIKGNYIRNSKGVNSAGIWTDWGCQGIRVTGNIVINCPWGYYAEAVHGPILVDNNIFIGNSNLRTLDASGVVYANNLLVNNGNVAVNGEGRECNWYKHGTMEVGARVKQPKQEFWWRNNLSTGTVIPNTNTSGYIKMHNKQNESSAISGFQVNANSKKADIEFIYDKAGLSLVPVTKAAIGMIMYPGTDMGEQIPADVLYDFFGKAYMAGSAMAGPFADLKTGVNTYQLWPISGQKTPEPFTPNSNIPLTFP